MRRQNESESVSPNQPPLSGVETLTPLAAGALAGRPGRRAAPATVNEEFPVAKPTCGCSSSPANSGIDPSMVKMDAELLAFVDAVAGPTRPLAVALVLR